MKSGPSRYRLGCLVAALLAFGIGASAQQAEVAITVDDLPYAGATGQDLTTKDARSAQIVNRKLLGAFRTHHVPVTGFVNGKRAEGLGLTSGTQILRSWVFEGFELGNHTFTHADANQLFVPEEEEEIRRGEVIISPLVKKVGKKLEFFRFPMNHTGDTKSKHDAISAFLLHRGYTLATCTIDNSDYVFNNAYLQLLARGDKEGSRKLRSEYLAYTSLEIDYYASLNKRVLGHEPPEVMLLHDNRLNAELIADILTLFERKRYRFISLRQAESDPAYSILETYITPYGPMWGYRWAKELNVQVNGHLEPEPPQWVVELAGLQQPHRDSRPHLPATKN